VGGVDISRFCVEHDLYYWCGLLGDEQSRLYADRRLAEQIREATGDEILAGVILAGVRFGGCEELPTAWRWGFGRK